MASACPVFRCVLASCSGVPPLALFVFCFCVCVSFVSCGCPPYLTSVTGWSRDGVCLFPFVNVLYGNKDFDPTAPASSSASKLYRYWGGPPLGVQILYTFPTQMGIKQIEQFSDIILHILRFLRSRLESQSWNSFNPFPIVNRVSAGVPTPPDSGKTPQLKTSKLAQNCGKMEVLHLQPSYGIHWSHQTPGANKGFIRF